ncbi:MAG: hypothetical protein ABI921_03965 [Panacibacter sp.]
MKKLSSIIAIITTISILSLKVTAQGCVAIRGAGAACMLQHDEQQNSTGWSFTSNLRYFKSNKHFSGKEYNETRIEKGTEVVNHSAAVDLALTRVFNNRWSAMIDVPILNNARSSQYEHGLINGVNAFNQRHSTHSFGMGDVRIAAYRWMLDPAKSKKFNFQLGLGIKFATGDYDYKDYWYNVGPGGTKELRTVDQSIQLGDGGTVFTAELNTYLNISKHLNAYGNLYYLVNPREQNGVRTYRETLVASLANEAICSVPDQYMARVGANYSFGGIRGLSVSGGLRWEGIPVYDVIGGSGDFRRPGYVMSAEPGVSYSVKSLSLFASVPVAIVRDRTQSVTDKEYSKEHGVFKQGDAAFSDYVVNIGFSVKF